MLKTAEAVSLGHPDKVADYISSYILERCRLAPLFIALYDPYYTFWHLFLLLSQPEI